ncbi:MAG: hypothetical protein ACW99U_22225, partial [Candidatus Thorarchaeota archaeon]
MSYTELSKAIRTAWGKIETTGFILFTLILDGGLLTETNEKEQSSGKFARRLGLIGATNLGLGAMLGGGIYVISGTAAGMVGPSIVLAYLVTGLMTVFTAINYSELAGSIPKQGGGYTFSHDTFGGFP